MLKQMNNNWIAVDWGTSNLRAWLMSGEQVLGEVSSQSGMGSLEPEQFEPTLVALISDWLAGISADKIDVIVCGMAGARQGWLEAPYITLPGQPNIDKAVQPNVSDERLNVFILSGLSQANPPDVMRGEETQITGFLTEHGSITTTLCMPGTHSKWVSIQNGSVTNFATFMTGELFALLSQYSILSPLTDDQDFHEDAFKKGFLESYKKPENVLNTLFSLRAQSVLEGVGRVETSSQLSGVLIGTEFSAMRSNMSGKSIHLLGAGILQKVYALAFACADIEIDKVDVTNLTVQGLIQAKSSLAKV